MASDDEARPGVPDPDGPRPIPIPPGGGDVPAATDGEGRPRHASAPLPTPAKRGLKKSTAVKIGLTAAVAGAGLWVMWPHDQEPSYAGVCVDKDTGTRIDDDECDRPGSGYHGGHVGWYFIPYGLVSPRIGGHVSGGSFDTPRGASYVTGGMDRNGGTIGSSTVKGGKTTTVRGGFGGSGKSGS